MSCNVNSCNKGLQPICLETAQFQPNVITCPQISTKAVESPLCDLLPTITSLPDFLINLPFLMLFVVSLPARFLYCMAYEFLVNADSVLDFIIYYLIYPGIDFATLPFIYFVLGFNNGLLGQFSLPSQPYGFLNGCLVSIEKDIYTILGDLFYIIGFANGFFSLLFIKFINLLIDVVCSLAFLTICFGVGACITFCIGSLCLPSPLQGCVSTCIQPFFFLQPLVCSFLNCSCALGTCPEINLYLTLDLGCSPSGCQQSGIIAPQCPQYNLNPVQQSGSTYTHPSVQPLSQVSFFTTQQIFSTLFSLPKAIAEFIQSLIPSKSPNVTSSEYPLSETITQSKITSYSEVIPPYLSSELEYCLECLSENSNCDLCDDVLNIIIQDNYVFPCCNYACLISKACNECYSCSSEEYTSSEQYCQNACTICNTMLSRCYLAQSVSGLPCYNNYINLENLCTTTFNSEICSELDSEYNYCKVVKANLLCQSS